MRPCLTIAAGLALVLTLGVPPAAAQEETTETASAEAVRNVSTPAQYRNALTDLSAITTGTNTIRINADLVFNGSIEPIYSGTRPLVIEGQDHTAGMGFNSGFLTMATTARVTIRDLDVSNAFAATSNGGCGGAIRSSGNVVIERSYLANNMAAVRGGAVCTNGNLTVTDSAMDANMAYAGHPVPGDAVGGGAISVGGNLTIRRSTFVSNHSWGTVGGGAVWAHGGSVTIEDSTFSTNRALLESTPGGALRLEGDGPVTITNSEIGGNTTEGGAGAAIHAGPDVDLAITGGIFSGNQITDTPSPGLTSGGGAIQAQAAVTVDGTQFRNNTARNAQGGALNLAAGGTITDATFFGNTTTGTLMGPGGAIFSPANDLVVSGTTFEDNETAAANAHGGALAVGGAAIDGSTFEGNVVAGAGADGGAVHNTAAGPALTMGVTRSTFTGNEAADDGGSLATAGGGVGLYDSAIWASTSGGDGGGIAGEAFFLENTTITSSAAGGRGGGAWVSGILRHVTLAGNEATGQGEQLSVPASQDVAVTATAVDAPDTGVSCHLGGAATITSNGFNADTDDTCGFDDTDDQPDLSDLGLGEAHRVGLGLAHVPLAGSPLVDAVPAGDCLFTRDQQGVARPFGGGCDIGAMEQLFPVSPLTDIPAWITDAGRWITWAGNLPQIMAGFDDDTFRADDAITRAQVVRLLHHLAGAPDVSGYPAHPFTDVPPWVEDAVRWAYEENVMEGFDDNTFRPDDPITRAQVVRMQHRFAGEPPVTGIDPHPFTDVPPWVNDAVTWSANPDLPLPIFSGIGPTTFEPNEDITRGQVARSVYRLSLTPDAWLDQNAASGQVIFQSNLT